MRAPVVRVRSEHTDLGEDAFHQVIWTGESVLLDFLGRRHPHGRWPWARLICNNTDCAFDAVLFVERAAWRLVASDA